jgi:uncharacterized protein
MRPATLPLLLLWIQFAAVFTTAAQTPSDTPTKTAPQPTIVEETIELKTAAGTLFGTLDLPKTKGPWPVAIIIAGSGPTDRDGNGYGMKNDCLKLLGYALAEHGIAALRYDKRGVGKSASASPLEKDLSLDTYADDAAAWIKKLKHNRSFTKLAIVGHSEGSLIGILAAKQSKDVDALVSLEGSGRDFAHLLHEQLKKNLPPDSYEKSAKIIDELAAGRTVENVPKDLNFLFRASVQPYLISAFKYDPAQEIKSLNIPILVVQGSTDIQTTDEDAKLLANANKNARLALIPNMNHVLKPVALTWQWTQLMSYITSSPLEPKLCNTVTYFLDETLADQKK